MSILDGCDAIEVEEFNGARTYLDPVDVPIGWAVSANNCKFAGPGKVSVREGFKACPQSGLSDTYTNFSIFYWTQGGASTPTSFLARARQASDTSWKVTLTNIVSGTNYDILSGGIGTPFPNNSTFAPFGQYLHLACPGVADCYVWDGNTSHTMDKAFQRPMLTTEMTLSLTQPGAGVCTSGNHNVGILFQTRTGYWTFPGPASSAPLTLFPSTVGCDGVHNILATLHLTSGTWPAWIKSIQIIYTSSQNNFQYYIVPGTITPVTPGTSGDVTVTFSISDIQLTSIGSQGAGTLADDYFSLLGQDGTGASPFTPKYCFPWGKRIVWVGVYGGIETLFVSEPNNPQWISANQHALNLPAGKPIASVFTLGGVLYVISSMGGMYAFYDNGGRPINFAPPQEIDGKVSTFTPFAVTVNPNGGYAIIGAVQGLYVYSGGVFPQIPLSYYQQDQWEVISQGSLGILNSIPNVIVKDHTTYRRIVVMAVSGVYSGGVQMMTWDYSRGLTPDKTNFSIWTWDGMNMGSTTLSSVTPAFVEIVQNPNVGIWEMWLGGVHRVFRQLIPFQDAVDETLYRDENPASLGTYVGVQWRYQTAFLPQNPSSNMLQHLAIKIRALAATPYFNNPASLYVQMTNIDSTQTITPQIYPLSVGTVAGRKYMLFYDAQQENISYIFTNGNVSGNGLLISNIVHYSNLFSLQR